MSSYCGSAVFGTDDFLGGKGWDKFKSFVKKETKAAGKTIARFDPTAKTAKYGNITKGILAGTAAVLTGGGALAVGGGLVSAAGLAATKVRTPPKTIAPDITPGTALPGVATSFPINSFVDSTTSAVSSANAAIMAQYGTSKKTDTKSMLLIGGGALALLTVLYLATK